MSMADRSIDALNMRVDAVSEAHEVLLDQRLFELDNLAFGRFEKALEANPIGKNKGLQSFLLHPKRWAPSTVND